MYMNHDDFLLAEKLRSADTWDGDGLHDLCVRLGLDDSDCEYPEDTVRLVYDATGYDLEALDYVTNKAGAKIDYTAAVELMDDDLREMLAGVLAPCTEQEFFTTYEEAHEKKFGEPWILSSENPTW